jgi:hypothetical protein
MPIEVVDEWMVGRNRSKDLYINVWVPKHHKLATLLAKFLTGKSNDDYVELAIPAKKIGKTNIGSFLPCWKCELANGLVLVLPFEKRKQNPNFHIQSLDEIESVCMNRVSFSE